jgi:hypothetical protein
MNKPMVDVSGAEKKMVDVSGAEAALDKVAHQLYDGCYVVMCGKNHAVSSCSCDTHVKRLHFVDHERWCLTGSRKSC